MGEGMSKKFLLFFLFCFSTVNAEDVNLPDISLWGYQGWHPTNDYNNMNVIDDYNSINPYHAATVYLPDFVTANFINTQYLRAEAIITIDGAIIGTVNMSGAGRFEMKDGSVTSLNAKDYSKIYFYGGAVHNVSIIEGAELTVFGYDFVLGNMVLNGKWADSWSFQILFTDTPANIILFYSKNGVTGDFNNDGKINMLDFAILANDFEGDKDKLFILSKNWLREESK